MIQPTRAWADTRVRGPSPPKVHPDEDIDHSFATRKNRDPASRETVVVATPVVSVATLLRRVILPEGHSMRTSSATVATFFPILSSPQPVAGLG